MTRIYSARLVMLVALLALHAILMAGNRWVGITCADEKAPQINFSGSTKTAGTIEINLPGFVLEEKIIGGEIFSFPKLTNGHPILEKGYPELQKINFSLELAAQGKINITVVSSEYTEYTGLQIPPSYGNASRVENNNKPEKSEQYSINSFYPGKLFDQQYPHIVRNTRAQSIQIYPLQYNAVTKTLRVYTRLVLSVTHDNQLGENELTAADLRISQNVSFLQNHLNTEDNQLKSGNLPSARGRMIIICPTQFKKAIQPLADWRNETGIKTEIIDAENFANPDQLLSFIKEKYYSYCDSSYLLLVGDAEYIPPYMLPYGASDNYYSYLAGNDHYPDILVGRFSAESVEDVKIQVNRTLEYEKNPKNGENWIPKATGIASSLACGDDLESDALHIRNLLTTLQKGTYTAINEFYEGSKGGADADGDPTTDMIISKIRSGTGVIFYSGHGSPNSWATGGISNSVVDYVDNNTKYPIIWSVACENGNFKGQRCLAEAWLRAGTSSKPSGAAAALMSSGTQTTFPPMEAQDKIAEVLGSPSEEMLTMGAVTVKGLMSMNDAYGSIGYPMTDIWILFGDPALTIRTAKPKTLITTLSDQIGEGQLYYKMKGNSVSGVVCLSQNAEVKGTSEIEQGSSNTVLDFPATGKSFLATITSMNYLPIQKIISVTSQPGAPEYHAPINYSKLQPIINSLQWTVNEGATSDYFKIFIGTDNPPTNILNGEKTMNTSYSIPLILNYSTTYYWQVVSVNKYGSATGLINQFTTVFKPDEDFEPEFKHRLLWSNAGSKDWSIDTLQHFDGKKALRSGPIDDNQFSSIIYPCEVRGCDFVSFWSKTSTENGDKLQFLIDNKLIEEWSGEKNWQYHFFTIQPGNHTIEWRYQKNSNGKSGLDAAWLDDIHLPVHETLFANSQPTGLICEGALFNTEAEAENYFNIIWNTSGDGQFNGNGLSNASYLPGLNDILHGEATLTMQVNGPEGCAPLMETTVLTINPLPSILLPADTISNSPKIEFNAEVAGNNTYLWLPENQNIPTITIDSSLAENGIATIRLQITSEKGCTAEKEIRIHFCNTSFADEYSIYPNPSHGNFSIKPLKGSAIVNQMKLVDANGRCVWYDNDQKNIIQSTDISIKAITPGIYQLITHSDSGLTSNKVVIQ